MNKARLSVVMLETNVRSFRLGLVLERERGVRSVVPPEPRPSQKLLPLSVFQWLLRGEVLNVAV